MADLKTNYKDDILDTSQNTKRKYDLIENQDGTYSLDDVTEYTQEGDNFGAQDINDTNTAINSIKNNLTVQDYTAVSATTISTVIDEYIAQANMSDGETRRVNLIYGGTNFIIEITRTGSDYSGIALRPSNYDWRRSFVKVGGASTVTNPFKTTHTDTYTASTRGASLDMGADHKYRYVNTNGVPNSNSGTKTITSSDANWYTGNVDMGATNSYRYVNAVNVYNKGKTDGKNAWYSGTTLKSDYKYVRNASVAGETAQLNYTPTQNCYVVYAVFGGETSAYISATGLTKIAEYKTTNMLIGIAKCTANKAHTLYCQNNGYSYGVQWRFFV